jgi:hypothetical protein
VETLQHNPSVTNQFEVCGLRTIMVEVQNGEQPFFALGENALASLRDSSFMNDPLHLCTSLVLAVAWTGSWIQMLR